MYIVTFYSFKGGVGRSMALANVASELVNRGRRVLVVDFDLEAPGLNTFDFGIKKESKGGIVEFVTSFIENNSSPSILDHIVPCEKNDERAGKLWLMPAGQFNDSYSSRLSKIDWHDLYENRSGYLLFEDLKAQWQQELAPDYVLLDSRTGHSDVSGICTRQLPNSIVFLFFPNEQNLIGLRKVVGSVDAENDIRDENEGKIQKHFVTSNVPDLDDEDRILADRLITFSKDLDYEELTATIHRYNSLALLNQVIFTLDRPKTRLAQEYRGLVDQIVLKNLEDRDGAVSFIKTLIDKNYPSKESGADNTVLSEKLETILSRHGRDSEILFLMSIIKERSGDYSEAVILLNKATEVSPESKFPVLRKARLLLYSGENESSLEEIRGALGKADLGFADVRLALNLLVRITNDELGSVIRCRSILALHQNEFISIIYSHFLAEKSNLNLAEEAFEVYIESNKIDIYNHEFDGLKSVFGMTKIGLGKAVEGMKLISSHRPNEKDDIVTIFNFAMAEWSFTKIPPVDLFSLALGKLSNYDFSKIDLNLKQCISLCYWVTGNTKRAKDLLLLIRDEARESSHQIFSCWSYLNLEKQGFLADIEAMGLAYAGEDIHPSFFK